MDGLKIVGKKKNNKQQASGNGFGKSDRFNAEQLEELRIASVWENLRVEFLKRERLILSVIGIEEELDVRSVDINELDRLLGENEDFRLIYQVRLSLNISKLGDSGLFGHPKLKLSSTDREVVEKTTYLQCKKNLYIN